MEKECYEFMSSLVVELFNTDPLFTYDFLTSELHISRTALSEMKQGRDMYMYRYLEVINYMMRMIRLRADTHLLMKELTKVLADRYDLVIGVVPHDRGEDCVPEHWSVLLEWETQE